MNNQRVSVTPQRLKYPGNIVGASTPAAPTLTDVMTKLSQIQQNQAQILDAIRSLKVNQISLCVMLGEMFEVTTTNQGTKSWLDVYMKLTMAKIANNPC
jgi:hypothetical protein